MDKTLIVLLWFCASLDVFANEIPTEDFFKRPDISALKISPDGKHFAATVEIKNEKKLAVLDAKTKKLKYLFDFSIKGNEVGRFGWFNNERVYASMRTKVGPLELPRYTGYLFAGNIDGSKKAQLLPLPQKPGKSGENPKFYEFLSMLKSDPNNVLVAVYDNGFPTAYKLNIYSSRKRKVKKSPYLGASLVADGKGQVRMSVSTDVDERKVNIHILKDHNSNWELLSSYDEQKVGINPISFTDGGKKVYMEVAEEDKPRGIYLFELETKKMELVYEIKGDAEIKGYIYGDESDDSNLIGITRMPNYRVKEFFNKSNPTAKLHASLDAAFPEYSVSIVNSTEDNKKSLVRVIGDRNPGTYYLYDSESKKMEYMLDVLPWIDPAKMAPMEPFAFQARDGLEIRGYLTMPIGKKKAPLVLVVHGGPYGPDDQWRFDREAQFLASRGFAAMQVNYRGSGGRGSDFIYDAYRKVGAEMQDDLTDATYWAIQSGITDKNTICIYGGSYGGYAAMMGVVKEPDLYQCAIAYVGVYDIAIQHKSDIGRSKRGRTFLVDAWNAYDEDFVRERSPIYHLDKLKAAVFLVHGKEDKRVPVDNYYELSEKLSEMNYPYESLLKPSEGHGFIKLENQVELYTKMENFLKQHIGK